MNTNMSFSYHASKDLKGKVGHFFVTPNINPAVLPDKCTFSYDVGEWPFPHIFVRIKDALYEFIFILFKYLLPFRGDVNKYKIRSTYYYSEWWMCYKLHILKFMFNCIRYKCLQAVLFYGTFLLVGLVLSALFLCLQKVQEHFYVFDQGQKGPIVYLLHIHLINWSNIIRQH